VLVCSILESYSLKQYSYPIPPYEPRGQYAPGEYVAILHLDSDGHSNVPVQKIIELLEKHHIQVLADVRSPPYSQYCSHHYRMNEKIAVCQKRGKSLANCGIHRSRREGIVLAQSLQPSWGPVSRNFFASETYD